MKKLDAVFSMISWVILLFFCAEESAAKNLVYGKNITVTEMDYHYAEVIPNPVYPLAEEIIATCQCNCSKLHLKAYPRPMQTAHSNASVGISIDWNLTPEERNRLANAPVNVKVDFSYQISAHYMWTLSNAEVWVSIAQSSYHDSVGIEAGFTGTRIDRRIVEVQTTLGKLGDRILLNSGIECDTSLPPLGTRLPPNDFLNWSSAEVTVHSIEISFPPLMLTGPVIIVGGRAIRDKD